LTKASIVTTSGERKQVLKDIESMGTKVEEQRLNITRLSTHITEEKIIGERLKKRNSEMKSIQVKLQRHQKCQEKQIFK
jgi:predicted aspartyl protease